MDNAVVELEEKKEIDLRGRPCKYETHVQPYLDDIYLWLQQGMTEYSIAEQLGIHRYTLIKYKEQYNDLVDTYTRARTERNVLVMNKMFQKATGEKVTLIKQKLDKEGVRHDLEEEMYIPPDVNAADLFLRNNDPDYKSAKSVEINNTTNNNFQLEDWKDKRPKILEEIRKLEMQSAVDVDYSILD